MRTQWAVLSIPQVLVNFINKLCEDGEKDKHIGRAPVFTYGNPDVEEIIIGDDGEEQVGMPEDMEANDRTPAKVRDIPDNLVGQCGRNAFRTPYTSETLEYDEDNEEYEPEHEVEEKQPAYVSEQVVPVSVRQ